jgi:hypothetical protein
MIGDTFRDRWIREPWFPEPRPYTDYTQPNISRQEFEDLRKEVKVLKDLLKAAKAYDKKHGEPNCEIDEKMKILKKIAEKVGVDLNDVLNS